MLAVALLVPPICPVYQAIEATAAAIATTATSPQAT